MKEWNQKFGENWMIGYVIEGEFVSQEDALESIYYQSYKEHFENNPDVLGDSMHCTIRKCSKCGLG